MNFFSLYVDGTQIPSRPLQLNFASEEPLYIDAYRTLFSGTGIHFLNEGNSISRDDYSRGYTLSLLISHPICLLIARVIGIL